MYDNQQLLIKYFKDKNITTRNKLVEQNMGLVYSVASKMQKTCSTPLDDLIQIGSMGLIQAIERYNPNKSEKLSSFALPFINGSILMYLRDKDKIIKIPRAIQETHQTIKRYARKNNMSYECAVKLLNITPEKVEEISKAYQKTCLDLPEISYYDNSSIQELEIILEKIPDIHAQIIRLIHIHDFKIQEIKNMYGLSVYQIKQIEKQGIELLKNIVNNILFCPLCLSKNIVKNGKRKQKQQYLCKNCKYQFVENPGALGRPGYSTELKIAVINALNQGKSFAWCKTYLHISKTTAYNWLKQYKVIGNKLIKL
ncbi:MAG: sigma-70 family RNA polymerase sigma factor [Minisyncoccia bacterium]|jgi:RNA polymerase sigma-B factor